jgi:asparagine N-glycosylation enzyme membrane subunit Stt3
MKKLWFRAKNYGWGWYPISWEGWLTLFAFLALLFVGQYVLLSIVTDENAGRVGAVFILYTTVLVMALIAVCWKTGEKPEWRWGPPKKK